MAGVKRLNSEYLETDCGSGDKEDRRRQVVGRGIKEKRDEEG